ncbi:induced myeloid leukemia cell differentiation protein Mcl-1 [Pelodytes ibericus]
MMMNHTLIALHRNTGKSSSGAPALSSLPRLAYPSSKDEAMDFTETRGWADQTLGAASRQQIYGCDGSLPSSQGELDEDEVPSRGSTSPPDSPVYLKDQLYVDTRQLLLDYFREQAAGGGEASAIKGGFFLGSGGHRKALATLRRVGGDVIDKHQMAFQGMLTRLSILRPEDLEKISEVPNLVFNDGNTNWGRILSLISFGAFVAKYLKSIHLEGSIVTLADEFTNFLMSSKREWIMQHNGWDGFVEFFHIEDYEGGLRTVLMAFAGVAGIGAGLAYMIR